MNGRRYFASGWQAEKSEPVAASEHENPSRQSELESHF